MVFNPGSFTGVLGELRMFGLAVLVGMVLGAVYDIFRIFRISLPHRSVAVFIEDFIFVLFSGMVYFCFSVEMLEGALRLYVAIGMIAGFGIYLLSLGRIISGFFRKLVKIISEAANFVLKKVRNAFPAKKFSGKIKKSS